MSFFCSGYCITIGIYEISLIFANKPPNAFFFLFERDAESNSQNCFAHLL